MRFYATRAKEVYQKSRDFSAFWNNLDSRDIVVFNLVQMSESAQKILSSKGPTNIDLSSIPLIEIRGPRNRIVHDYESVEPKLLKEILEDDLPELVKKLDLIQLELPESKEITPDDFNSVGDF
jgi:uncharacterized protein with HEPN domain